jgi:hypothetical protein
MYLFRFEHNLKYLLFYKKVFGIHMVCYELVFQTIIVNSCICDNLLQQKH